jgi:hypothetical protein
MRYLGYIAAFAIGAAAIVVPLIAGWNPETMKTSIGFGIGVVAATGYALMRNVSATARPGTVGSQPGVLVDFGNMEWFDWLVMGGCVVGGFVLGSVL